MSKVTYPLAKINDRVVFNADGTHVLLDTGFPHSVSGNGKIGPFNVGMQSKEFFYSFINLTAQDGSNVTAILSPMDGYNCRLTRDDVTITDEEEAIPEHDYFLPFVGGLLPIVEGTMNGVPIRFFFDSGARMTMFGETALAGGKPAVGSYTEWLAMLHQSATLPIYDVELDFPCGLHYNGRGALVQRQEYMMAGQMMGIQAMLGIDFFNEYDVYFSTANNKRGIALSRR
ncbi:MAG: hypothetical protein J6X49_01370 [Victivallales bacterium]|nr:hypothetical protein [Victivallales bacterium]